MSTAFANKILDRDRDRMGTSADEALTLDRDYGAFHENVQAEKLAFRWDQKAQPVEGAPHDLRIIADLSIMFRAK
jgi:hypothetical protein